MRGQPARMRPGPVAGSGQLTSMQDPSHARLDPGNLKPIARRSSSSTTTTVRQDEQYLNKPIIHYKEMMNIAGGSMVTGQYAKGSSDALATEVVDIEEETSKPNPCAEDRLHATILASSERIAITIEKSTNTEKNAIDGLWESMKVLPGFSLDYLAHYHAYLVDNPRVAMAFKVLEEDQNKVWVSRYVKNTFPEA
ncbi:hypothetical protein ZWY2020_015058 [Hordeum vulgare]|nr:hypothetical protein ZWY2020_015058 [Hordeum vulgare]